LGYPATENAASPERRDNALRAHRVPNFPGVGNSARFPRPARSLTPLCGGP